MAIATIVLQIRLPRALMAMSVGAGLSIGGAAFQGMFRNPLVSTDVLGGTGASGTIYLRPRGTADTTGQLIVTNSGDTTMNELGAIYIADLNPFHLVPPPLWWQQGLAAWDMDLRILPGRKKPVWWLAPRPDPLSPWKYS